MTGVILTIIIKLAGLSLLLLTFANDFYDVIGILFCLVLTNTSVRTWNDDE